MAISDRVIPRRGRDGVRHVIDFISSRSIRGLEDNISIFAIDCNYRDIFNGLAGLSVSYDNLLRLGVGVPPSPRDVDTNRPVTFRDRNYRSNITEFVRP